jgi:hypothetical protein
MNVNLYKINEFNKIYNLSAIFLHFQDICNADVKYLKSAGYYVSSLKNVSNPYIPPKLSPILKNGQRFTADA